jgi:Predicted periplasmic lipoprotein (DUF2279)
MLRFSVPLLCAAVVLPASSLAAQSVAAGGKSDREFHMPASPAKLESFAMRAVGAAELELDGSLDRDLDVRVEPAFAPAGAEEFLRYNLERLDAPWDPQYDLDQFTTQVSAIGWDVAGAYGLAAAIGFSDWDWGSEPFHFESEGWFGEDTKYAGMDKLGHAYTGYVLTEYFTQRIAHSTEDRAGAALTGAVLGMGIQAYVEILDGFSNNGFSTEDLVADGLGVGFSVLRNSIPGMAEKVDFRMEYLPSGNDGRFRPYHDYSGQKYVLVLKLSGFEEFEDTPLRFVELHAGYFARGFTEQEQADGKDVRREPYLAVGFNLRELLGMAPVGDTTPGMAAERFLEYTQLPYTYAATSQD